MNGETVFYYSRNWLFKLMDSMGMTGVRFMLQVAVLILVPTALCGVGYLASIKTAIANQGAPRPNQGIQVSMFIIGILTGLCLPVDQVEIYEPAARLWLVTICMLITCFTPALLGFLMVPDAKAQRNTIRNIYVVILILGTWQIIREVWR